MTPAVATGTVAARAARARGAARVDDRIDALWPLRHTGRRRELRMLVGRARLLRKLA